MAGTTAHTMLTGIITFFICEIYALSVAVFGGSIVDILENKFLQLGLYDISGEWNNFTAYTQVVNIFYLTPYIIGLLGVVILVITIWHRHGTDREAEDEYDEYQNL